MVVLLVTGSRSIKSQEVVNGYLNAWIETSGITIDCLVHGGAIGVDTLAGNWAKSKDIPVKIVRPDFKTYPVDKFRWKAYTVRDYAMVDMVNHVVAIWDGISGGTQKTFEYANAKGKLAHIFHLKKKSKK